MANSTSLRPGGARRELDFTGNQVRLIGRADTSGGKADVYLDGVKQLCGIDFWCPQPRDQQVLCYKNGLAQGKHSLEIVAAGDEESRLHRHAGLSGRRPVLGRPGGKRLRARRRPHRDAARDLRLRGPQGLRRFQRPRLAAGNRVHHATGHLGRPGAGLLLDGAATQRGGRHVGSRALPLRRLRPRLHRVLHRGARADLSRATEVLPGAKAARARRVCDQHPDWRQAGGRRHGHRRHGRRAGQGGRPGRQRRPAATRRDRDSFPRQHFHHCHDPGDRSRPRPQRGGGSSRWPSRSRRTGTAWAIRASKSP